MMKVYVCYLSYKGYGHLDYLVDLIKKAKKYADRVELTLRPWQLNKVDMNMNMAVHEFLFNPKFADCDYFVAVPNDCMMPYNFAGKVLEHPDHDIIFGWTLFGYPPYFPTIGRFVHEPAKGYLDGRFKVKYLYAGLPFICEDDYIPKKGTVENDLVGFVGGMFIKRQCLQAIVADRPEPFKYVIDYTKFPCKFMTEDGYFVQHLIQDREHYSWIFDYSYEIQHNIDLIAPFNFKHLTTHYRAEVLNLFTQETHNMVCTHFGWSLMPSEAELLQIYKEAGFIRQPH